MARTTNRWGPLERSANENAPESLVNRTASPGKSAIVLYGTGRFVTALRTSTRTVCAVRAAEEIRMRAGAVNRRISVVVPARRL